MKNVARGGKKCRESLYEPWSTEELLATFCDEYKSFARKDKHGDKSESIIPYSKPSERSFSAGLFTRLKIGLIHTAHNDDDSQSYSFRGTVGSASYVGRERITSPVSPALSVGVGREHRQGLNSGGRTCVGHGRILPSLHYDWDERMAHATASSQRGSLNVGGVGIGINEGHDDRNERMAHATASSQRGSFNAGDVGTGIRQGNEDDLSKTTAELENHSSGRDEISDSESITTPRRENMGPKRRSLGSGASSRRKKGWAGSQVEETFCGQVLLGNVFGPSDTSVIRGDANFNDHIQPRRGAIVSPSQTDVQNSALSMSLQRVHAYDLVHGSGTRHARAPHLLSSSPTSRKGRKENEKRLADQYFSTICVSINIKPGEIMLLNFYHEKWVARYRDLRPIRKDNNQWASSTKVMNDVYGKTIHGHGLGEFFEHGHFKQYMKNILKKTTDPKLVNKVMKFKYELSSIEAQMLMPRGRHSQMTWKSFSECWANGLTPEWFLIVKQGKMKYDEWRNQMARDNKADIKQSEFQPDVRQFREFLDSWLQERLGFE